MAEKPDHPDYLSDLGLTYTSMGIVHGLAGRAKAGLSALETAGVLQGKLVRLRPNDAQYQDELGKTLDALGGAYKSLGNAKEAEEWHNKSLEIYRRLVDGNAEESKYKVKLSRCYNNLAALQIDEVRRNEARQPLQKSIEISEKLVQEYPKSRRHREITLTAYMNLDIVQASLDDHEGAKLSLQQSVNIAIQLVQENPAIIRYKERLAFAYLNLAHQDQSRLDEAIAVHQELLKHVPNHEQAWLGLGAAFWRQENHDAAADAFARGLEVQPKPLFLLSNDAELALIQGDKDRFRARIAEALPQVTTRNALFAILPFLVWLDNPTQGWDSVMTAIRYLESGITFSFWNFSTTAPVIARQDASTQQAAQHFIAFFTGQIDLPTLEERLTGR
jgi:tetratricopeptide (TPR) repeat protein